MSHTRQITANFVEPLPAGHQQRAGHGVGLFVGVNTFDDQSLKPLRYAVHDAVDLAHAFAVSLELLNPKFVCLAIDQDPTDDDCGRRLEELLRLGARRVAPTRSMVLGELATCCELPASRLVTSFSTHGFGKYLLPKDGHVAEVLRRHTAIATATVDELREGSKAALKFGYHDSCRNDPVNQLTGQRSAVLEPFAMGFAEMDGCANLQSCAHGQVSYEFDELHNGVATHYLLRALGVRGPLDADPVEDAAKPDDDGVVTLHSVMRYLESSTSAFLMEMASRPSHDWLRSAGARQTPHLSAPESLRRLPLARVAAVRAPTLGVERAMPSTRDLLTALTDAMRSAKRPFEESDIAFCRDLLLKDQRTADEEGLAGLLRRGVHHPPIDERALLVMIRGLRTGETTSGPALKASPAPPAQEGRRPTLAAPHDGALEPGKPTELWLSPDVMMRLVPIAPGEFLMGSHTSEAERFDDEGPQHKVRITKPLLMGVTVVTQAQWETVMGTNPSHFKGPTLPVETVNWFEAVEFCNRLTDRVNRQGGPYRKPYYTVDGERVTAGAGTGFRLPTEAEWEYACRAGTLTPFHFGSTISPDQANFDARKTAFFGLVARLVWRRTTTPVGSFPANAWGLYDTHGNVWEWCWDWYGEKEYSTRSSSSVTQDPTGPASGEARVVRGGSWGHNPRNLRSANRGGVSPADRSRSLGFRLCLDSG